MSDPAGARPVTVLLLEDRPADAEILVRTLEQEGLRLAWRRVDTEADFVAALAPAPDLILADHRLPGFEGRQALALVRARGLDVPFILVSGTAGEDLAVEYMRAGATDFLLKDRLGRLGSAVRSALAAAADRRRARRAEEALAESERRYRTLFEHVPVGLYRTRPDGVVLDANHAMAALLGYESAAALITSVRAGQLYVDPADRGRFTARLERQGVVHGAEIRLRRRDGAAIWVRASARAVLGPAGAIAGYEGSMTDITAERAAAEALKASEERFRALVEGVGDGVLVLDAAGTVTDATPGATRILGHDRDLGGRRFLDLAHPDDLATLEVALGEARARGGQGVPFTARLRHAEGSYRSVEGEVTDLLANPRVAALVVRYRDATEARRARDVTRAMAEMAARLSRSLDLGVVAPVVAETFRGLLGVRSAAVWGLDAATGELRLLDGAARAGGAFGWTPALAPGHGVAGLAVRRQAPVASTNVLADPDVVYDEAERRAIEAAGDRSVLAVPLRAGDAVFGVVSVGDHAGRVFTEEEMGLARALADQASLALANARLHAETERRRAAAEALLAVGHEIAQSLDPAEVAHRIALALTVLFPGTACVMYALDPGTGDLVRLAGAGQGLEWSSRVRRSTGVAGLAVATGRAVTTEDALADGRFAFDPDVRSRLERSRYRAILAAPLLAGGEVIGALVVAAPLGRRFTGEDADLTVMFADRAALALANARLYEAALAENAERRRAQATIETREQWFRALLENALDIVTVLDREGRIGYESPSVERVLGYTPGELQGRLALDLVHPDDAPAVAAVVAENLDRPGSTARMEFRLRHKDGTWRTLEAVGRNLLHHPEVAGIVVNSRDITERRRVEAALRQSEKLATMGQLLAGVAHELNNPLSVVMGRAQLIRLATGDSALGRQAQALHDAAQRCGRIVKNFLALARQRSTERSVFSLNQVVQEALELLAYPLRVDGVRVETDLDAELPLLWGDAHQVHQVVVNLVTNAHQAMRETAGPRVLALRTARLDGERVVLTVRDTGPGIPDDLRARIFEPFFTTKPAGQGTGLGLALCESFVEGHGGRIRVESTPGQGATFAVELPAGAPAAPAGAAAPLEPPPAGGGLRVLVVDDEPDVGEVVQDALAAGGHRVALVTSSRRALEELSGGEWDVVLCDVKMPEMDGPALHAAAGRVAPRLARRFVFLTGDTLGLDRLRAQVGDVPVVAKPFDVTELVRVVRETAGLSDTPP